MYLQYCWYQQSFGFGQFFPQYHPHPCECRWPRRGGSPRCPASSWKANEDKKTKKEEHAETLILFIVSKVLVILRVPIPGGPVRWQHRPRGSGGSFWTSSILLTLCRCVRIKGQTPRSAASCGCVPAMCEIRQAGGAGMLGAVACRRAGPQGGVRAHFRSGTKSLHFILYWPEGFQNLGYLKFCFAGWHSWNCGNVRTGRPL